MLVVRSGAALMAVAFVAVLVATLALPTRVPAQGEGLATPTPHPVDNLAYEIEEVGGNAETLTFVYDDIDGFTLGETTVTSQYPRGMVFTLAPESSNGRIADVILFIRFVHDSSMRVVAEWDDERAAWVAHPWETGEGQPPWSHFDFYWRVRDETGASVETPETPLDYWDPNRTWFRLESDHILAFWTGFMEDDPDYVGRQMAEYMAGLHERKVLGFGRAISYKPITVIFPDRDTMAEMYGSEIANNRVAGFTSDALGMSVQVLRGIDIPPGNETCIWATQPEDWTLERRVNTIFSTAAHEITHLYQFDVQGGTYGFLWWSEGQAEYFSNGFGNSDRRLMKLAELTGGELPTLHEEVGARLTEADGCYALAYDVGPSFINWLLTNYGGLELHVQIVERMRLGDGLIATIEDLTGEAFLDLENAWRTGLGFRALTLADIDPALALEPYEDDLLAVGDTVTLPATPPLVGLNIEPGEKAVAQGQCFGGMDVTVMEMGTLDGVPYFQIDCMGMTGWVTRDALVGPQ